MSDEGDNDVDMAFAIAESLRVYTDSNSEPIRIDEDEALRQAILDSQTYAATRSTEFDEDEALQQTILDSQTYAATRLTEFDEDEALRKAILDSQTDTAMVVSIGYDEDDALQQSIWNSQIDVGEFDEEEVMFNQALMESQVEFDTRTHKTTLLVPLHLVGSIVGKGFNETNRIASHCGANCKISARRVNNTTDEVLCGRILISADTADALDRAEDAVMLRYIRLSSHPMGGVCSSKLTTPKMIRGPLGLERYRHVYIDNSNIYVTALHAFDGQNDHSNSSSSSSSSQCNYAVRINVRGLTSLLERGGGGGGGGIDQSTSIAPVGIEIATRLTAGSKPPKHFDDLPCR